MLVIPPATKSSKATRSSRTRFSGDDVESAASARHGANVFARCERNEASLSDPVDPPGLIAPMAGSSLFARGRIVDLEPCSATERLSGSGLVPAFHVPTLVDKLTADWENGRSPAIEDYLACLDPDDSSGAIELIYHEFCLAEAAGWEPEAAAYLARFPRYSEQLGRLLEVHGACTASLIDRWIGASPENYRLPEVGDSIGPYVLLRVLGRGSFAKVFLAEQSDLENRLVVAKVSTRITREPWLLAKSRHAHIVEILTHAQVDDGALQLICMPFWGGATLAAVLEHRRASGLAPRTGRDLLADLDSVAAREFPTVHPARPAREILTGLNYSAALAWVVARLAEALSHAFSRGVAHGDVKPSNILLAADGSPMLLDFNLAQDASPVDGSPQDCGGTIPYMPPERLLALAAMSEARLERPKRARSKGSPGLRLPSFSFLNASSERDAGRKADPNPEICMDRGIEDRRLAIDPAPHHADIYSLGMVLLEGLTGRMPESVGISDTVTHASGPERMKRAAAAYAAARSRGAVALIRAFESSGGRMIEPGLRPILERCLDSDPRARYHDAFELADDLDRWRTGRKLAFAAEPFLSVTMPRWFHARRRLVCTAALLLVVLFATSGVALMKLDKTHLMNGRLKLSAFWDGFESGSYRFQRPHSQDVFDPENPETIETANRALKEYHVLGAEDWRQRDDVRCLSAFERDELELWLCEQAYRYARVLSARPDSPADWNRAVTVLARTGGKTRITAFAALESSLKGKLARSSPDAAAAQSSNEGEQAPAWLEEYLLGVALETDGGFASPVYSRVDSNLPGEATQKALGHYQNMLESRPGSFWGHYRAAVASHSLGQTADAVVHLRACLETRPNNPVIRGQLAGCLAGLKEFDEALIECDRAIEGSSDFAEFYRSRAFIKASLGRSTDLAEDLWRFELLSGTVPRDLLGASLFAPPRSWMGSSSSRADSRMESVGLSRSGRVVDEKELYARANLATTILTSVGDYDLAASEVNKILILEPDNLQAFLLQTYQAVDSGDMVAARRHMNRVFDHRDLATYAHENPSLITKLHNLAIYLLHRNKVELAEVVASHEKDLAKILKDRWGQAANLARAYYDLARVHAVLANKNPELIDRVARELYHACWANREFMDFFMQDPYFDDVRARVRAILPREMKPTAPKGQDSGVAPPAVSEIGAPVLSNNRVLRSLTDADRTLETYRGH